MTGETRRGVGGRKMRNMEWEKEKQEREEKKEGVEKKKRQVK